MIKKKIASFLIVCFVALIPTQIFASSYFVFSGGFSVLSTPSLTWNTLDGASSTEGTNAIAKWNGISSKVKISKTSALGTAKIQLSLGIAKPPSPGNFGVTTPYKKVNGSLVLAKTTETWSQVVCTRYKNDTYLNNSTKRLATSVHEIGHALSLGHCTELPLHDSSANHIMHQGVKTFASPSTYDKNGLKYKWGN